MIRGRAWKLGDDISTDHIAPGRYFHLRNDLEKLAEHLLEDVIEGFAQKINKGDVIVAGKNFGLGSSREHAARIIKIAGISCVIAKSFARIFYRNAINVGLPLVELKETDEINQGDELEVDLERGVVRNLTTGREYRFTPIPKFLLEILKEDGIVNYLKKHGTFPEV